METKELQVTFPLRKQIELSVTAFNSILKDEVKFMPLKVLLNNCHPLYRADYARKLHKEGYFSDYNLNLYINRYSYND